MPEDKNPSVVNEGGQSNYSMSRGDLAQSDAKYIDKLQKSFQNPSTGALAKSTYFPSANKGIQAGTFGSKSLGNIPIFVANQGLIPIGMLEAKRKAEQQAAVEEFAMFGPANNEALDQYIELVNPIAQDEFNAKLQTSINGYLDDKAMELGGDYTKARMLTKYDPGFKNLVRGFQTYAKMYNQLAPEAIDVLAKAADPVNFYVSPETVKMATEFIRNHDNLGAKNIDDLNKFNGKFQAYMGIDKAVTNSLDGIASRIEASVEEDIELSTDANKVLKTTEKTGFYTDPELAQLVKDELESYPFIADDPKAKAQFEKQFLAGIAKKEKITLTNVRKKYNNRNRAVNSSFGISGSDESGFKGTTITGYTHDGLRQYKTEAITIPKVAGGTGSKRATVLDINANDVLHVRDQKGNVHNGYFNTPLQAQPIRMYKDENGVLQVSSSINIQAMQQQVGLAGEDKGLKKGDISFNVIGEGGKVIDILDLGGGAEIITAEESVSGQFTTQFGNEIWGNVVMKADKMPTPKETSRGEGARVKFVSMEEATANQKAWSKDKRERQAREGYDEEKKEKGTGTYILEDLEIKSKSGNWVPYSSIIANKKGTRENITSAMEAGTVKFRIKSE